MPPDPAAAADTTATDGPDNLAAREAGQVVVMVRDLMFGSRLKRLLRDAGVPVRLLREPNKLAETQQAVAVVADLTEPGVVDAVAAWVAHTGRPAAGFGPHVEVELFQAARAAGFDAVWPRSRLAERVVPWAKAAVA